MQLKKYQVESALVRKGFVQSKERDHEYFIYHTINGQKTKIKTKTSHGGTTLVPFLVQKMSEQCALSKDQFKEFVECSLSREGYESVLQTKDIIPSVKNPDSTAFLSGINNTLLADGFNSKLSEDTGETVVSIQLMTLVECSLNNGQLIAQCQTTGAVHHFEPITDYTSFRKYASWIVQRFSA